MNTIRIIFVCLTLFCGINSYAQVKETVTFESNDAELQNDLDLGYRILCDPISPAEQARRQKLSYIHKRISALMENHRTDTPAQFPGGEEALLDFLSKNIEYPNSELCTANTVPTVVVAFIVEKDGTICEDNVLIKLSSGCPARDQAAINLVKKFPNFIPAKHHGKNIAVIYNLPVKFITE